MTLLLLLLVGPWRRGIRTPNTRRIALSPKTCRLRRWLSALVALGLLRDTVHATITPVQPSKMMTVPDQFAGVLYMVFNACGGASTARCS